METPFFKLLRKVELYAPEYLGKKDILIAGEKVAAIKDNLDAPPGILCKEFDLEGKKVLPGFIDSHVHMIGGGGEGGFKTRTPEVMLSKVVASGVTTVVGLLGTDGVTRHVESLLAKAHGLEEEGLSTYIFTGAYELPTPTITGSVRRDIMMIDKVIGAGEIAMSDHRSSQPTALDYRQLAGETRVAGMLSGKAGIIDVHLGDSKNGLKTLFEITDDEEIPRTQFLPTHMNRNRQLFEEGIEWGKKGGYIDITSGVSPKEGVIKSIKPSCAIKEALDRGVSLSQILMSSDGNGSVPLFDEAGDTVGVGVADQSSMFSEFRDMVLKEHIPPEEAVQVLTSNVAKALKIASKKGFIKENMDADFIVIDEDFQLEQVWCRGQLMVESGKSISKGTFE